MNKSSNVQAYNLDTSQDIRNKNQPQRIKHLNLKNVR